MTWWIWKLSYFIQDDINLGLRVAVTIPVILRFTRLCIDMNHCMQISPLN